MKNLTLVAFIVLSLCLPAAARAADGTPVWTNIISAFNGVPSTSDSPHAIAIDTNGNVLVTGYGIDLQSNANFETVKYSPGGGVIWTRSLNGTANGNDAAAAVAVDNSGNVFVTGKFLETGNGYDFQTIKYSSAGSLLFQNHYNSGGSQDDLATAIAVDASGEICVAGQSYVTATNSTWTTIKFSNTGTLMWTNTYNGPGSGLDQPKALVTDTSGGVYVTGYSTRAGGNFDFATVKYSSVGTPIWTSTFNGAANGDDLVQAMAVDKGGNVYVTGFSTGTGGSFDYVTIKYDGSGAGVWTNFYNGAGNSDDEPVAVAVDNSGNVYVTGTSIGAGGSSAYVTIKYSNSGAPVWTNFFGGVGNHGGQASALAVDSSGEAFVTGTSHDAVRGDEFVTIKYSTAGTAVWTNFYNGGTANAMALDASGNVYVTGGNGGYTTIEYANVLGSTLVSFVTTNGNFGPENNQFVMSLEGPAGSNAVVSATTNFQNWIPITTNQLSPGILQVTDKLSADYPKRFYRAQLQ